MRQRRIDAHPGRDPAPRERGRSPRARSAPTSTISVAAGASVEYHAVDVVDEAALARLVDDVERAPRPDRRRRARRRRHRGQAAGRQDERKLVARGRGQGPRPARPAAPPAARVAALPDRLQLGGRALRQQRPGRLRDRQRADEPPVLPAARPVERARRGPCAVLGAVGADQFGAGMVTAETEAKFASRGVTLVSAAAGRALFAGVARCAPAGAPVELVLGQGPWEAHEAAVGRTQAACATPAAELRGPILGAAALETTPLGEQHVPGDARRAPSLPRRAPHRRRARSSRRGGDGADGRCRARRSGPAGRSSRRATFGSSRASS